MQGLRQGAKVWGEHLHSWIMGHDSRITCIIKAGKCVYSIWTGGLKMVFARWVDDLFGFSSDNNKTINELLKALSEAYPLKIMVGHGASTRDGSGVRRWVVPAATTGQHQTHNGGIHGE